MSIRRLLALVLDPGGSGRTVAEPENVCHDTHVDRAFGVDDLAKGK